MIRKICRFLDGQRGALFGMDARIAMAIFAGIAVIVGYFAFGKVKMAKNSALMRELTDISSAIQDFQTDMGTFYKFAIENPGVAGNDFDALFDITKLKAGFQQHWNGPYYYPPTRQHPLYGQWTAAYGQNNDGTFDACTSSSDCYVWIFLSNVPNSVWETVNSFKDEDWGSTPEAAGTQHLYGNVRSIGVGDPRYLIYNSGVSRKK